VASRIQLFRRKIALGEYELTGHAKEEMEQDWLTIADVKAAIYNGRIVRTQRHGTSRRKDIVEGRSMDERRMRLVCRLTESRLLRIITIFAVK